jgi:hypothetical protein
LNKINSTGEILNAIDDAKHNDNFKHHSKLLDNFGDYTIDKLATLCCVGAYTGPHFGFYDHYAYACAYNTHAFAYPYPLADSNSYPSRHWH